MWQTFGYYWQTLVAVIKNTTFRFWLHRKQRKTVSMKFPFSVTKAHACIQNASVEPAFLFSAPRECRHYRESTHYDDGGFVAANASLSRPQVRLTWIASNAACTCVRVSISGRLIRRHASACDTALLSTLLAWCDVKIRRCSSVHKGREINKEIRMRTNIHRQTVRETDRQREKQTDRQTDRQKLHCFLLSLFYMHRLFWRVISHKLRIIKISLF